MSPTVANTCDKISVEEVSPARWGKASLTDEERIFCRDLVRVEQNLEVMKGGWAPHCRVTKSGSHQGP